MEKGKSLHCVLIGQLGMKDNERKGMDGKYTLLLRKTMGRSKSRPRKHRSNEGKLEDETYMGA